MVYKFIDQKKWSGVSVNEQIAEELHKPVVKKFKIKWKIWEIKHLNEKFKNNIWAVDLGDMESLYNRCFHQMCVN